MRTSYTVTLPEEPPAAPFPALAKELRPRSPLSPSLLLSTFVGLLLNKAKVRGPFSRTSHAEGLGSCLLPGSTPVYHESLSPGMFLASFFPSFPRVSGQGMPPFLEIAGLLQTPPLLISKPLRPPHPLPWMTRAPGGSWPLNPSHLYQDRCRLE